MIMYAAAAAAGNIFWPLQNLSNIIIIMLTAVLSLYLILRTFPGDSEIGGGLPH